MPRKRRSTQPGTVYHLISRFVAGEWFIRNDLHRQFYLSLLGSGLKTSDWRCFAYAIMSNHIHLGLVAGVTPLREWLRDVHREFAEWVNQRDERIGGVFVRGPNMRAVHAEGVNRLVAYIDQNPVRAGVVARARDSSWTSHRAYAGLGEAPRWLDTALGLDLTGFRRGCDLAAWVDATAVTKAALKAVLVGPKRAGRPPNRLPILPIHRDLTQLPAPERDRPVC